MKNLNEMLQLATKLNKQDMKTVMGGSRADYDKCRLFIRRPDGTSYWSVYVSYAQASSQWNNFEYNDGSVATGYCCKSCVD